MSRVGCCTRINSELLKLYWWQPSRRCRFHQYSSCDWLQSTRLKAGHGISVSNAARSILGVLLCPRPQRTARRGAGPYGTLISRFTPARYLATGSSSSTRYRFSNCATAFRASGSSTDQIRRSRYVACPVWQRLAAGAHWAETRVRRLPRRSAASQKPRRPPRRAPPGQGSAPAANVHHGSDLETSHSTPARESLFLETTRRLTYAGQRDYQLPTAIVPRQPRQSPARRGPSERRAERRARGGTRTGSGLGKASGAGKEVIPTRNLSDTTIR